MWISHRLRSRPTGAKDFRARPALIAATRERWNGTYLFRDGASRRRRIAGNATPEVAADAAGKAHSGRGVGPCYTRSLRITRKGGSRGGSRCRELRRMGLMLPSRRPAGYGGTRRAWLGSCEKAGVTSFIAARNHSSARNRCRDWAVVATVDAQGRRQAAPGPAANRDSSLSARPVPGTRCESAEGASRCFAPSAGGWTAEHDADGLTDRILSSGDGAGEGGAAAAKSGQLAGLAGASSRPARRATTLDLATARQASKRERADASGRPWRK